MEHAIKDLLGYKKHIIFDMDDTLTSSKLEISKAMWTVLKELAKRKDVVILTGSTKEQIDKQIPNAIEHGIFLAPQSGNQLFTHGGQIYSFELTRIEKEVIMSHISRIIRKYHIIITDDMLQNRGCQISFSLVGHNADPKVKREFDPNRLKRMQILKEVPLIHDNIAKVSIGGTTCLDYTRASGDKGNNLQYMMKELHWRKCDCLFVGDAITDGNDSSIKGVCDTYEVKSLDETFELICSLIG